MRDWDVTPDPLLVSWSRYGYCVLDLVSYRPCKELKDQKRQHTLALLLLPCTARNAIYTTSVQLNISNLSGGGRMHALGPN